MMQASIYSYLDYFASLWNKLAHSFGIKGAHQTVLLELA